MTKKMQEDDKRENLLIRQACPVSASIHWRPEDDTEEEITNWYKLYNKLPCQIRLGLIEKETEERIIKIAKKFEIYKVGEVGEIARIIRDSFINNSFQAELVQQRIVARIKLKPTEAKELFFDLISLRSSITRTKETESEIEELPIIAALKKFPEINRQQIGGRKIKVFGEANFQKATVKNWLDDYTLRKGAHSHNNLERSDYIFNSENINRISFQEKKAISLILESYDEDTDLKIDIKRQEILFNFIEEESLTLLREGLEEERRREKEEIKQDKIVEKSEKEKNKQEYQSRHLVNLKDV